MRTESNSRRNRSTTKGRSLYETVKTSLRQLKGVSIKKRALGVNMEGLGGWFMLGANPNPQFY